ncbi:MAG: T9SS type A sorting domain-containing protein [Bacteroidales bacterium]|nr:T9SS type A sorting domain-containing protein [Bacteroidales bacterium]
MKIRTILIIFFIIIVGNVFSQKAINLKFTDIFGNYYTSDSITSYGQYIIIDFFNNGCSSCHDVAPYVDTMHRYFGCNCGDAFFVAMNVYETSTDEEVFQFTQNYHLNAPAVSGEGGGADIAELLEVPWTPYFVFIDPNNKVIYDTTLFSSGAYLIRDTLLYWGLNPRLCEGTVFSYYELRTANDTFPGIVDIQNKLITVDIGTKELDSVYTAFFIVSSNSTVLKNSEIQISGKTPVDISDTIFVYNVVAEVDTIIEDWTVIINGYSDILEVNEQMQVYPNPSTGIIYLPDYKKIETILIYDIEGRFVSKIIPSQNEQNLGVLPKGIYILVMKTHDSLFSQKIILQ